MANIGQPVLAEPQLKTGKFYPRKVLLPASFAYNALGGNDKTTSTILQLYVILKFKN